MCGDVRIVISYPGYKSKRESGKIIYDYRVNTYNNTVLGGTAISHVNLIADIYCKALRFPETCLDFYALLTDLAVNGGDTDLKRYGALADVEFGPVSGAFKRRLIELHQKKGKTYNEEGNLWSYSVGELADFITWIVLQEDINYPMPYYQGRRMPFYRYMEAVHCACFPEGGHDILEVAERALSHRRELPWSDAPEIPYREIERLR